MCVWGITAYPTGFEFRVASILRDEDSVRFRDLDFGRQRFAAMQGGDLPPQFLRVGVLCADGSKATNLGGFPLSVDDTPRPGR